MSLYYVVYVDICAYTSPDLLLVLHISLLIVHFIQNGETALYHASKTGQSQVVQLLIEKGANVNEVNKVHNCM